MPVIASVLADNFPAEPLGLSGSQHRALLDTLSEHGIRGGAVYDALVAATARHHGATLLSMDGRADATYQRLDVTVQWVNTP